MSAERFESLAAAWHAQGRPPSLLLDGYELIALRCWSHSRGAVSDGLGDVLREFIDASNAAQPEGWLDDHLSERSDCRACGERYRIENLTLCTHCRRMVCHRCAAAGQRAANGNHACACGGELVG